jgi:EipB-like
MKLRVCLLLLAFSATLGGARAEVVLPLAAHRAAYEISLVDSYAGRMPNSQTPIAASGLIAYEFTGSSCEGYASNFRQLTELERSEGEPISSDVRALTFEDGDAKSLKFQIDSQTEGNPSPAIVGAAQRAESGDITVALSKPSTETMNLGKDILFPTQHIEHIIAKAKQGGGAMQARVYDGSDTGKKVFETLTVIGKQANTPTPETEFADTLGKIRRWPVTVSYFDEAARDGPPEYILSFDLYENGVSGTLKLDYGSFALIAKLSKLEMLPTPVCAK